MLMGGRGGEKKKKKNPNILKTYKISGETKKKREREREREREL